MIVFKNYFKIVKKYIPILITYTVLFLLFAITASTTSAGVTDFTSVKPKIAIVNQDNNVLSDAFVEYITNTSEIVSLKNNEEETLKDALFFRQVDMILTIPEGFGNSILNQKPLLIETLKVPDSYMATYSTMIYDQFLNIASIYAKQDIDVAKMKDFIMEDLKEQTVITIASENSTEFTGVQFYYNFASFILSALSISVIGILMYRFHQSAVEKRSLASPISYRKINRQIFLANLCLVSLLWLFYLIISVILYPGAMLSLQGLLISINSFVFCVTCIGFALIVTNLVHNLEAQSAIVNVFSLGTAFLCGAFVPQELLGSGILQFSHIFPTYWFITNNNYITSITNFNGTVMIEFLKPILMMIGFIILFAVVNNMITRIKRKKS